MIIYFCFQKYQAFSKENNIPYFLNFWLSEQITSPRF